MPATRELLMEQLSTIDDQINSLRERNVDVTALVAQRSELLKKIERTNEVLNEGSTTLLKG